MAVSYQLSIIFELKISILLRFQFIKCVFIPIFNSPKAHRKNSLRALVFDSTYDQYRGVIANVALFDGVVSKGDKIVSAHTQKTYEVNEVGVLNPNEQPAYKL